jgi:hypothetical protein
LFGRAVTRIQQGTVALSIDFGHELFIICALARKPSTNSISCSPAIAPKKTAQSHTALQRRENFQTSVKQNGPLRKKREVLTSIRCKMSAARNHLVINPFVETHVVEVEMSLASSSSLRNHYSRNLAHVSFIRNLVDDRCHVP